MLDTRSTLVVRDATDHDIAGISAIHNQAITETTGCGELHPMSVAEHRGWLRERVTAGYPVLVAEIDDDIAGYSSYAPWRHQRSVYQHTMEGTIYVAPRFQRQGAASALVSAVIDRARAAGNVHAMIASIESSNIASIALARRFGFRPIGTFPETGRKFGRWLDLTLMQLMIGTP